jgi:integrase
MKTKATPLTRVTDTNGQPRYKKKIGGRIYYFGYRGCTEQEALDDYLARKDGIVAGCDPKEHDGMSLEVAVNNILYENKSRMERGDISEKHYLDHVAVSKYILAVLPRTLAIAHVGPRHFQLLRDGLSKLAPITQKNRLAKISAIFRRAVKLRYMVEIHDADALKAPSQREIRLTRPERTILDPKDLRTIIDASCSNLKAALLLGLNCAYINCDVCNLTVEKAKEAVATGWLGGRRNKTGVARLAMLWDETKTALQTVIDTHPGTRVELFLNDSGKPWVARQTNTIARELKTLVEEIGIPLTFARLRHYFQTIGEEKSLDLVAVRHVMGHADRSISQVYRDRILKDRIGKVCNAVREWYLG